MVEILLILNLLKISLFGLSVLLAMLYAILILFLHRLHNPIHILTLNICFTTLCISAYFVLYFVMWEYYIQYLFTVQTCTFLFYIQTIVICQASLSFSTLTINRFCTIVYHTKGFFKTKKFMTICIACQWTAGCLVSLPFTLSIQPYCVVPYWLGIYTIIITIAVPTLITLVANLAIFKHIHSSSRRVQPQITMTPATEIIRQQKAKLSRRDLYLLRHTIFMFSVFVIAWTPIFSLVAIDYSGNVTVLVYTLLQILAVIGTLACILDLFFYNRELRNYIKDKYFRCF